MDAHKALTVLGRRWPIVALTTAGALIIGAAAIATQPEEYRATSTLWISANRPGGQYLPVGDLDALAQTYARLADRRPTIEQAIRATGQSIDPDRLAGMVSARVVPRALVEVSVTAPDREQAIELTNAVATAMTTSDRVINSSRYSRSRDALETEVAAVEREINRLLRDIEPLRIQEREGRLTPADREALGRIEGHLARQRASQAALLGSLEDLRIAEAGAATPISVVEPAAEAFPTQSTARSVATLVLAALAGLAAGIVAAFGLDLLDDRLGNERRAAGRSRLAMLGTVPTAKDQIDPAIHPAYRRLASHVVAALPPGAARLVIIGDNANLAGDVASRLQQTLLAIQPAGGSRVYGSGTAAAIPFLVGAGTPVLIAADGNRMTARRADALAEEVESLAGSVLGVVLVSHQAARMRAPEYQTIDQSGQTPAAHTNGLALNRTSEASTSSTGAEA